MTDPQTQKSEKFAMSMYASKADRAAAINKEIDKLAKKRDHAADVLGKVVLAWSYQVSIDALVDLLEATQ
jgi:hypothetical protein